jgi:hypothetical protein
MNCAEEKGLGAMIYYILSLIKIGSGIKIDRGGFTDTQRAWWSHKPLTFIKISKVV